MPDMTAAEPDHRQASAGTLALAHHRPAPALAGLLAPRTWGVFAVLVFTVTGALALVIGLPRWREARNESLRAQARTRMAQALVALRREALDRRGEIDRRVDPLACGAIGELVSPITSKVGILPAKQSTCNPSFAAIIVDWLLKAGLERGDTIAVALTGSFPALNIASIVAAETLGLKAIVVSSVSASMFGANTPELTWLDMESALADAGMIRTRSVAATLGAKNDNGGGLSAEGRALLRQAVARNNVPLLRPRSLRGAVRARLQLYRRHAGAAGVKAYINVGGALASVGSARTKSRFRPGLNTSAPRRIDQSGVMSIMSRDGLPVIHLGNVRRLCEEHGLPYPPKVLKGA